MQHDPPLAFGPALAAFGRWAAPCARPLRGARQAPRGPPAIGMTAGRVQEFGSDRRANASAPRIEAESTVRFSLASEHRLAGFASLAGFP